MHFLSHTGKNFETVEKVLNNVCQSDKWIKKYYTKVGCGDKSETVTKRKLFKQCCKLELALYCLYMHIYCLLVCLRMQITVTIEPAKSI